MKPLNFERLRRPQTGNPTHNTRNGHVGNIYHKTYCTSNKAWMFPQKKYERISSPSVQDMSIDKINSKVNRVTSANTRSDWNNISERAKKQARKLQLKYRNTESVNYSSGWLIVQLPFSGTYREVDVMNNQTLFSKTVNRDKILSSHNSNTLERKEIFSGSRTRHMKLSQYTDQKQTLPDKGLNSSFGSSFPFFSSVNMNYETEKNEDYASRSQSRVKTPFIEKYESEDMEWIGNISPKSILKKPNTAQAGLRKRVQYNLQLNIKKHITNEIEQPQSINMNESSYFNK